MENTIAVTPGHTLVHWAHKGKSVIHSLQPHESGETRGGIPLCVPQFSVQQRDVAGCKLPLHGLLMYSDHGDVSHNPDTDTITAISHFSATEKFNWNHTVTTKITETANSLFYHVTISRAPDCPNPDQMPISLGFHPYFATHGSDFSFKIGDYTCTQDTPPDDVFVTMFDENKRAKDATLQTANHTITISSTGFDEYCLWTDDASKYVCIEPIWQYREFGLPNTGLMPGEEKVVTVTLQVTPV